MNLRKGLLMVLTVLFNTAPALAADDPDSKVKVGDPAPSFTATTTDKTEVSLETYKGQVLLLNFFAIWCPPCRTELPLIETNIWKKLKSQGVAVLVVGREHAVDELRDFKKKQKLTVPIAGDPKREVYGKYAENTIPRNYVIGKDGKIAFVGTGFNAAEFEDMVKLIEKESEKPQ